MSFGARIPGATVFREGQTVASDTPRAATDATIDRTTRRRAMAALVLTVTFWSFNFVVGRAVAGQIPPLTLSFLRWFFAFLLFSLIAWPHVLRDRSGLIRAWPKLLLMGLTSVAGYNTFVYLALERTTAINAVILNATMPIAIAVMAALAGVDRLGRNQLAGIVVSFCGVAYIVAGGDPMALLHLKIGAGDLWILGATLSWGVYSVALRFKPAWLHPFSLLWANMLIGMLALSPLALTEVLDGRLPVVSATTVAAIAYVAIFPSIIAYILWNGAVAKIGPNRAGLFMHLMPILTPVWSMLFLGERLGPHHLVGGIAILAGLVLTTRTPRAARG
ncbi:MAG: EamA/RhaT family transporter [Tistrella sp.]|uniref:EamA/RhaT family transporter n=1 Tax=Tistrella mobilis TaxID=171437 RepID=A0A3B9IPQ6_9PROT|nr:EamA/RhaT family transporter [Tistrella sp.]MAM75279.1 EamA/RhaT family transporter [Tistrella sp.]MBA78178.1 EamA/RhaT family transporter [Tistrella sp.]HAE49785.1 EamA/RhaT family transporter [Tistrella mobilis]